MSVWFVITSFGTAAALLPLSLAIAGWLAAQQAWRAAALWLVMVGGGAVLVAISKAAFIGWGIGIRSVDFTCISGHTMLSTTVYPVAGYLIYANAKHAWRLAGMLAGIGIGLLIGYSRLMVHAHSTSEVVAGAVLGIAISLTYLASIEMPDRARFNPVWLATTTIVLLLGLHQQTLPTEHWITRVALQLSGHKRPFVRATWLANRSEPVSPPQHYAEARRT